MRLPKDIFIEIAKYVDGATLFEMTLVSRYLYFSMNDEYIWKSKCFDDYRMINYSWKKTSWKRLYIALRNPEVYSWRLISNSLSFSASDTAQRSLAPEPRRVSSLSGKEIVDTVTTMRYHYTLDRYGSLWIRENKRDFLISSDTIEKQHTVKFQSISGTLDYCIGLAKDGSVWQWRNPTKMQRIKGIHAKVIQVTRVCTILTDEGEIWFSPNYGKFDESKPEAKAVFGIRLEDTIVQMAASGRFLLVLTQSGRVLSMDTSNRSAFISSPNRFIVELSQFSGPSNRSISGGYRKFAVCTDAGKLLLGSTPIGANTRPTSDPYLENKVVSSVAFGMFHCAAITINGELIVCGRVVYDYTEFFKEKYVLSVSVADNRISVVAIGRE